MAQYTIITNREQEAGLNYVFDKHGETEGYATKEEFLQGRVNQQVLNQFVFEWKRDQSISLDLSIATIPEANETKASTEIQAVIVANGGQIVTGPPPTPVPGISGRSVQAPRGTSGNPIQVGGANKTTPEPSRPDGSGDNASEK